MSAPPPRRPARPRVKSEPGTGGSPARPRVPSGAYAPLGGGPAEVRPDTGPTEIACPNCGEPMLSGWGTTCGKCRPNLVSPKTMFLARGQVALPSQAPGGMTLGWLIVISSNDEAQRGTLIELDQPTLILSRADAAPTGVERVVKFDDSFMSSGHAILKRPASGERTDAFTIRDRDNPGPSVNGTFVNSRKLGAGEVVRLGDGDIIKVGTAEMLFKSLWLPPVAS